jgi:fatty acid synthase
MVSKLTQNHGIDFAILTKNVSNRLPELLADEAKIVQTENTDISFLSRKI